MYIVRNIKKWLFHARKSINILYLKVTGCCYNLYLKIRKCIHYLPFTWRIGKSRYNLYIKIGKGCYNLYLKIRERCYKLYLTPQFLPLVVPVLGYGVTAGGHAQTHKSCKQEREHRFHRPNN